MYSILKSLRVIGTVFQKAPNLQLGKNLNNERNLVKRQWVANLITKAHCAPTAKVLKSFLQWS